MTLEQIKAAVDNGYNVHWMNPGYKVIKDRRGEYQIVFTHNVHCIGLTHKDGVTLNGKESEFYVA